MSDRVPPRPRPRPEPTAYTRSFWEATRRGELLLQHCRSCDEWIFYPRPCCVRCGGTELDATAASGRGTIYSYTVARRATHPAFRDRVPYVIAIVELAEGPRLTTNLVECEVDAVAIGMPVELTFEPELLGIALPLFKPALASSRRDV